MTYAVEIAADCPSEVDSMTSMAFWAAGTASASVMSLYVMFRPYLTLSD